MPAPQPFLLERWFAEYEFLPGMKGLSASGPFAVTTRELLDLEGQEAVDRYLNLRLEYIENPGSEALRQAIARVVYATVDADTIRVTGGASEALFLLIWTMVQAGDNIVVESPCYDNVTGVASALGVEVRQLPLTMEQGWKPDPEQLARLIDKKTRIIYLIHPHNPSGSVLTREEMQAIARVVESADALLVNDEVFRPIALDGEPMPSILDVVENAISIGDMTKPWGLGGLHVGWIASRNPEHLRRISAARDYSTMCGSAPGEFLAEMALRHSARVMEPRLQAARHNLNTLAKVIEDNQEMFRWNRPEAGYTAFVQLPFPTEDLCRYLATEKRVLFLPGRMYGDAYDHFIRIGYGCRVQQFQEGLGVLMDEVSRFQ